MHGTPAFTRIAGAHHSANETKVVCQVPTCAELANSAVRDGMAAVIGLQSTGMPRRQCPFIR